MNLKGLADEYCKDCGYVLEDTDEFALGICHNCLELKGNEFENSNNKKDTNYSEL